MPAVVDFEWSASRCEMVGWSDERPIVLTETQQKTLDGIKQATAANPAGGSMQIVSELTGQAPRTIKTAAAVLEKMSKVAIVTKPYGKSQRSTVTYRAM